jgi:hypothetical protein
MAANPYHDIYRPELITIHDAYVVNAFQQAQDELLNYGCDPAAFLEIRYDGGGHIQRIWDGQEVQTLPERERLRLFPQLNGLFKLVFNNRLYPA